MTKGRKNRLCSLDGRRCSLCKKLAKDKINNEYLCRVHSPQRLGFATALKKKEKDKK